MDDVEIGYLVTEQDFDETLTNSHFVYYLIANGIKPGDRVRIYLFGIWISEQSSVLWKSYGLHPINDSYKKLPEGIHTFTKYLRKVASANKSPEQLSLF